MIQKRLLIVIMVLFMSSLVFPQGDTSNKFSFSGAVVIPTGDFGGTDGEEAGFAKTGFGIMAEHRKLFNDSFGLFSTLALNINSVDEEGIESAMPNLSISADNYTQFWVMTGVGFETTNNPDASFYGMAQIGVLFSSFPDVTYTSGLTSVTQETDAATAFAYGVGIGARFKMLNIGLKYYMSKPEYTQSGSDNGVSYETTMSLPVSILQLAVGVNF